MKDLIETHLSITVLGFGTGFIIGVFFALLVLATL